MHPNPTGHQLVVSDGASSEADTMSTVMLQREARGRRAGARAHSVANNVMGDIKLDLTQATFDAPVVEVTGTQLMGSMLLRVPSGVTIVNQVTNVMGDTTIKDVGEPDPTMPTIVLKGTNIMGDIKVRGPNKLLRWRQALT